MSPEQLRAKPIDKTVDIWGLGIVLFEMIIGHRPFVGESVSDIIAAILNQPVPFISDVNQQIPAEISTIISKMLEKEIGERYQTVKKCVFDLKSAQQHLISHNSLSLLETAQLNPVEIEIRSAQTDSKKTNSLWFKNISELIAVRRKPSWTLFLVFAGLVLISLVGWLYVNSISKPETAKEVQARHRAELVKATEKFSQEAAFASPDLRLIVF